MYVYTAPKMKHKYNRGARERERVGKSVSERIGKKCNVGRW